MRKALFNIIDADGEEFPEIESHLSFEPYLRYLRKRLNKEHSLKKSFFEDILSKFNQAIERHGPLTDENFLDFEQELRLIHASLNPPLEEEEETFWALGFPMGQKICFGTDSFYDLLQHNKCQTHLSVKPLTPYSHVDFSAKTSMLYSFIMERLYGVSSSRNFELIHSFTDASGLQKYYRINIDHSFVDVNVIGELPAIDHIKIRDDFSKSLNLGLIKSVLPLEQIRLEGFSVLTVHDITTEQALENIKNIIINSKEVQDSYSQVFMALKNLAGNSAIEFTLTPLLKLNGKVVFDSTRGHTSIWLNLLTNNQTSEKPIDEALDQFIKKPEILIFNKEEGSQNEVTSFQNGLMGLDIENYALIPIFHYIEMVGVIEVFSKKKGILDEQVLSRVFSANTLLAQLLKDETIGFEGKINEVIKDKFTSLQSAVQWKFNEVAWEYLQKIEEDKPKPNIGDIKFEKVYPLYGAIDIRSSTIERNNAAFQDVVLHLELLENVLLKLKGLMNVVILDEMIFNCNRWQQEINEELMDSFQIQLNEFFNHDVTDILAYFKENLEESHSIIRDYEKAIHQVNGVVYKNRNALENSIQLINSGINGYLELFDKELQSSYPCYFEKFRSDGVEYDIYIGQSISPNKNFSEIYLKNIRLWQLTSMAAVARITHSLLDQMEKRLFTTQLIFVNASPIDIGFRTDERRFDVEGAYNIRYQIIKKRIDKVNIKDTDERLTQPGKIALVYFTEREAKEYSGYIQYLQENGTLLDDLEELELEELQGVKGLKAFRVGVNLA